MNNDERQEGKTYTIVDEWCSGFLQGIALAGDAWQPLVDEKPGILRPFQLFATPEGWAELDAAADEARCMRSGLVRSKRRSTPYMLTGYLVEKLLRTPWIRPVPCKP